MKKINFKFQKLLLVLIGVLITSLTTPVKAWDLWGCFYFSNYSTQWSDVSLCIGTNDGSQGLHFTKLDNTQLWYRWLSYDSYGDAIFFNGNWNDENWWSGWDYRPSGRTWSMSSDNKWGMYCDDYKENKPDGPGKRYYFDGVTNSSKAGYLPTYIAYLRLNFDEEGDGTYDGTVSGSDAWNHGVSFDFTGTYMSADDATAQSTIYSLNKNGWYDNSNWKWGYEGIPVTGEITLLLKTIDTGFEIEGWAYSESATSPAYTDNKNNPTFQVLSTTSYVAFIRRKSYTVTLNDNGGSGGSGSKTVRYDLSTNMTTSVSVPSKSGYSFQGYYTGQDGTGSMVINASGVWQKNVTNYTGTDGSSNPKWIRDDGATLYAKWTQTVDLHDNHGGSNNGSISAIYNGVMSNKSVPTYTDHTLDLGYYAETGCSNKVMNLDGTLVANVTVSGTKWTSSTNKWIHDGDGRLYAHWKVNAPSSITCTDNVVTISVPSGSTVHYTTNGTDPTASSPTYDPSNKPVIASSGITVKAIAVQSGCTNSTITSQAVTYTPVYDVDITATNVSNTSGSETVLKNHEYIAVFAGNVIGYKLPTVVSVTINRSPATVTTDYTWSVSDGVGTLTILENKINGDVEITVNGEAKIYEDGVLESVDGTDGKYSVTYNDTKIEIEDGDEPTKAGFEIVGYYLNYDPVHGDYSSYIADPDGTFPADVTDYIEDGKWIYDGKPDLYTKWRPKTYTITLHQNYDADATSDHQITMNGNFSAFDPAITVPTRAGYDFDGYYLSTSGGDAIITKDLETPTSDYFNSYSNWIYDDNIHLYAHWDEVELTFDNNSGEGDGDWNTASNWSPACVPTSEHDVTIAAAATVSGSAVAKSVTIDEDGSLTISSTGALEVAGSIDNDDPSKLVVRSRGALIYDGSTNASVEMSMSSGWHLVALPVAGVSVSSAFAGKGVYTYVWDNTKKAWERRGYYDDLMGNEAVLVMGSTGHTFSGALVSTGDGGGGLTYDGTKANGDVNMFANNLTAPIKVSGMTISGSSDGAVHIFNGSGWTGLVSGDVIPAMQGYAILASSGGGSFSYSYATAVRGATSPNAPLNAPRHTTSDILDHITIYVSGNEWNQRIRLYENEQFTDEIDLGYEALHMEGEGFAGELYAQAAEKMNILAVPDLEGTVVGFIPGEATNYTISFEGDGRGYYLNDVKEEVSTLIEEGNTYTFTPDAATNATRFIVSRTPMISSTTTGVDQVNAGVKVRKQLINGVLYIIRDGRMYDATGAMIK